MQFVTHLCIILNGSKYSKRKTSCWKARSIPFPPLPHFRTTIWLTFLWLLCFLLYYVLTYSSNLLVIILFCGWSLLWKFIIVIKGLPHPSPSIPSIPLIKPYMFDAIEWKIWDCFFFCVLFKSIWTFLCSILWISGWGEGKYCADNSKNLSFNRTEMDKYLYYYNHTIS